MRYLQLAIGILVVATSYLGDVLNNSGVEAYTAKSASPNLSPQLPSEKLQAQSFPLSSSAIRLNSIRSTPSGLMLIINANPQIRIQREENPERLIVDLQNTTLLKDLHKSVLPVNRLGIKQVRVAQFQNNPAIARLVFDLDPNDPNSRALWGSQYIAATNTLLLSPTNQTAPQKATTAIPVVPTTKPSGSPMASAIANSAVIEKLVFTNTGQLQIEASQPVNYQVRFDLASNTYNLIVPNAKISASLQRPTLAANSPIERIRLSQLGNAVEIGIKPIAGWQVREMQRFSNQSINLQLTLNNAVASTLVRPQPALPSNNIPSNPVLNNGDRRRGVIVIDAGHGGRDPGALGNGIQEKNVVLPISVAIGQTLQSMGYTIYYTRTNDVEIDLQPRVSLAERVRADVFVSIHANSLDSRSSGVNGVETFYARGSTVSRELASYVQSQIIGATGANNRGAKAAGFYVITKTSMPAILVETGFVTNPTEAANLNNPAYQRRMADAIARGVDQFLRVRNR